MKLLINHWIPFVTLFVFSNCTAQVQHGKTETVKIYGNCGMCEKTIENAAYKKGEAKADWDRDNKMAVITFDSTKTTVQDVLKRIAAAGYDSDLFTADDNAYANLPACCQYDRPVKAIDVPKDETPTPAPTLAPAPEMVKKQIATTPANQPINGLSDVYAAYFNLKDALVATDGNAAATNANTLMVAIDNVKMETMPTEQHSVWMKYQTKLKKDTERIKAGTDIDQQRTSFMSLSKNMYEVMKVIKPETAVYLDHCPMYNDGKGADWLSKEKGIKNPYYGKQMLTCGNVKETIE